MRDSEHEQCLSLHQIENTIREAPYQCPAHLTMHARVDVRCPGCSGDDRFDTGGELTAETFALGLVPVPGFGKLGCSIWAKEDR